MRKEFFIENYSVKMFKSKHGKDMFIIKMSDIKGDFNVCIPVSYLDKIIQSTRSEATHVIKQAR